MKTEGQLKLQAYLDGELSPGEVREVENILKHDKDAGDLLLELRQTAAALRGNELSVKTPETREFYWSQIERRISAEALREKRPSTRTPVFGLRQLLASFAGVAAVFAFIAVTGHRLPTAASALADEVEAVGDQETVTFHDHAANMTVVWVQGRSTSFTPTAIDDTVQPE